MSASEGWKADFAGRLIDRRQELGLNAPELAQRSGVAVSYVECLERGTAGAPQTGVLSRLAAALETTPAHLVGADLSRRPHSGHARYSPRFDALTSEQCAGYLALGGVGRFVFASVKGPAARPVNFGFVDGDIFLRTPVEGGLGAALGSVAYFEVDRIDEATSEGWTVLVTGKTRLVDEPAELARLESSGIKPWPCGHGKALIRIASTEISGSILRREPALAL